MVLRIKDWISLTATGPLAACLLVFGLVIGAPAAANAEAPIRIGASSTAILVWLAQDRGLFAEEGATVEVSQVPSGVQALIEVQAGTLDLGTSSEFAFISRAIDDPNLCIFATISASRTVTLLARADRISGEAEELSGKRIGVTLGSAARFMLWQFLALSGIDESTVTLVDLVPDDMVAAMRDGTVDASIVWEPYVTKIRNAVNVELVEFEEQTDQHYYFTLQGRCDLAERRPSDLKAVLAALVQAERQVRDDEAAVKATYGKRFGIRPTEVDRMWPLHSLSVRLPQDLVSLMETEGRWRVHEGLTEKTLPNVFDRIRLEPLESVDPSAIQIIR